MVTYNIIIAGGGAAGFFTAINIAENNPKLKIIILERGKEVLTKVKVSGGGRCNVTHAEFIPKELSQNYPRGEKELLGPFHTFMTGDTIEWFEKRGVALKIEEDGRMFPVSDSSQTIIDCFLSEAKKLVAENNLENKIIFKGKFLPCDLDTITPQAYIGINLVEPFGQNQLLSLANKFFDYMHHAVPQVTMDFTEYRKINEEYEVAILIENLSIAPVLNSLNFLLNDKDVYLRLQENCLKAREVFNWQNEEKKLIGFYEGLIT